MMGTNYYLRTEACPHCGRSDPPLHIGKSSAGWCFGLHVDADLGIETLDQWAARWAEPKAAIVDEYGDVIEPVEMLKIISGRAGGREQAPEWYRQNGAERGPSGLARNRIDGRHCIGHGPGTWDLIAGEFS